MSENGKVKSRIKIVQTRIVEYDYDPKGVHDDTKSIQEAALQDVDYAKENPTLMENLPSNLHSNFTEEFQTFIREENAQEFTEVQIPKVEAVNLLADDDEDDD